jgi:hypothetical protein
VILAVCIVARCNVQFGGYFVDLVNFCLPWTGFVTDRACAGSVITF